MAVMRETFHVCDVCNERENVETVRVTAYGRTARADLCPKHRVTIDEIMHRAAPTRRSALPLSAVPIVTEDQLAAKRKAAATPQKPAKGSRKPRQTAGVSQGAPGSPGPQTGVDA